MPLYEDKHNAENRIKVSEAALKDACAPGNPKDATFDDVKNMFLSLM